MTSEHETLAQAALQFSEAIKAERERTSAELEAERSATLDILAALRRENVVRSQSVGRRFAFGLFLGGLIGLAIAFALAPRSGSATRSDLQARFKQALNAFQQASSSREAELWADFRKRLKG